MEDEEEECPHCGGSGIEPHPEDPVYQELFPGLSIPPRCRVCDDRDRQREQESQYGYERF